MPPTVAVLTPIPSPYQVELWDAVARSGTAVPRVVYVERAHADRLWTPPAPKHEHLFLSDGPAAAATARTWVTDADLFVASWYASPPCRELIRLRASSGRPWAYWGERPGFSRVPVLGRVRRWWHLRDLRRSPRTPIWGIGSWAIEKWRDEFGTTRPYRNLPYVSDLSRFARPPEPPAAPGHVRVLYSGSLIPRKGVDLLAEAFATVAQGRPGMTLEVLGTGELEPQLRARLAGFGDRVRFSGFAQWPDLPAAYHRADVLVAPSRYDGWALVVPEGLAAGLPVISTDRTGAARDLIRHGVNGWVVPAGDGPALAAALAAAGDLTPDGLARMSAAARDSVSGFQLEHGVSRFAAAIRDTLGEPG